MKENVAVGQDMAVQLTGSEIRSATGQVGSSVTVQLTGSETHAEAGRLSWVKICEYWEKRPLPLLFVAALTFGSPFLGLFLAGWIGVVVGLAIAIVAFAGGLFAVTRVREITRPE
jgi:hypothetical protein